MRKQGACWVDELEPLAEGSRRGGGGVRQALTHEGPVTPTNGREEEVGGGCCRAARAADRDDGGVAQLTVRRRRGRSAGFHLMVWLGSRKGVLVGAEGKG